jgi:hypothetical protein
MATENSSPKPPASRGPSRWAAAKSSPPRPYRFALRLIGIPVIAVAAVLLYSGLRDRLVLPECDSARAKNTLSEIFKQLNFAPLRYAPIKTISSTKEKVVCSAVLPLPDGANVAADYSFYWEGSKANMKYSVSRRAADSQTPAPPKL